MVNLWEGVDPVGEAKRFADLWGVDGPVLVDEQGELATRLGVRGVPTNVFVDRDGTVTAVGGVTPQDLEAATQRLLGPECPLDPPAAREWRWDQEPEHIERYVTSRGDEDGAGPPPG